MCSKKKLYFSIYLEIYGLINKLYEKIKKNKILINATIYTEV